MTDHARGSEREVGAERPAGPKRPAGTQRAAGGESVAGTEQPAIQNGSHPTPDSGRAARAVLPAVLVSLPAFLPAQRWFGNKERAIEHVEVHDTAVVTDHPSTLLAIVDVFHHAEPAALPVEYFLPLSVDDPSDPTAPGEATLGAVVAHDAGAIVRDGIGDAATCRALLRGMLEGRTLPTARGGRFVFQPAPSPADSGVSTGTRNGSYAAIAPPATDLDSLSVRHVGVEQSNSSVIFGSAYILKALRRLAAGTNPEIEIPAFLGQYTSFDRVPALVGWAEYHGADGAAAPVGVLQQFVPNRGDGWSYVLRRVASLGVGDTGSGNANGAMSSDADRPTSSDADGLIDDLAALGRTLAELHLALASRSDVADFTPEPITPGHLTVWHRRTIASLDEILTRVEHGLAEAPAGNGWSDEDRQFGRAVRAGADRLRATIDGIGALADGRTVQTRHHGDFHLGQTLVSDGGWIIIDFEGEPLRSLAERRAKQTPLRDLAGLLRSLDYAHATAVRQLATSDAAAADAGAAALAALFDRCRQSVLTAYVETIRAHGAPLLPADPRDLTRALLALELEKALYELTYELGNRPDWVSIPLSALARLAETV